MCRRAKRPEGFANTILNYLKGIGEEKILLDWNEIAENFGMHFYTCCFHLLVYILIVNAFMILVCLEFEWKSFLCYLF